MHKFLLILFATAFLTGCGAKPEPVRPVDFSLTTHAVLVGRIVSVVGGWDSEYRGTASVGVKSTEDNREHRIISSYGALALKPGTYGLSRSYFYVDGVPYSMQVPADNFLGYFGAKKRSGGFFGTIELKAGEVIYAGDLGLDIHTLKDRPMFFVTRDSEEARKALAEHFPECAPLMQEREWQGASFELAKVWQKLYRKAKSGETTNAPDLTLK